MMDFKPSFEGWERVGFSKHNAKKWISSGFDLKQARQWLENGFSLDSAITFRKEGIAPLDVKSIIINEIRRELR